MPEYSVQFFLFDKRLEHYVHEQTLGAFPAPDILFASEIATPEREKILRISDEYSDYIPLVKRSQKTEIFDFIADKVADEPTEIVFKFYAF